MAQKYVWTNPDSNPPMGIVQLSQETDWEDEDIEAIVKLEVGAEYHGNWPEPIAIRRVE
jgi:hypothetical protein